MFEGWQFFAICSLNIVEYVSGVTCNLFIRTTAQVVIMLAGWILHIFNELSLYWMQSYEHMVGVIRGFTVPWLFCSVPRLFLVDHQYILQQEIAIRVNTNVPLL